jgi:hypothetical protein
MPSAASAGIFISFSLPCLTTSLFPLFQRHTMTTQGSPRLCGVCNNFLLEFLSFERAFARDFAKSHVDCLAENHDDCQKCYLDEYAPYASASEKIIYHPSIMSLKAAVDTDCYICTRMWKKLDRLACLPPKFPKLFKRIDGWRLRRIWFEEPLNKFEILLSNSKLPPACLRRCESSLARAPVVEIAH